MTIYRFGKKIIFEETAWENPAMLLGGKGWALQKMCGMGLNVPPGFTIGTNCCNMYRLMKAPEQEKFLDNLMQEVMDQHMPWLEKQFGYMPLVSVRSGAPVSMPGMMDTILNVGMHAEVMQDWEKRIGKRAAIDSTRRLIQMLGHTAYHVDAKVFEAILTQMRFKSKVKTDAELGVEELAIVLGDFLSAFHKATGSNFPTTLGDQLREAIRAVFDSWMNPRAIEYRKLNNLSEAMGTAVTVQAMVFGNMGEDSGSGVLFTRDPSTGHKHVMGEYLQNAQGEDVVAGIRTPVDLKQYSKDLPVKDPGHKWLVELNHVCDKLEDEYRDMVDVEFTVQKGELFILQSRVGKRSAAAAFKIAVDLQDTGVISIDEALSRLTKEQYKIVRRPIIDPKFDKKPLLTGLPACPGVAVGKPVFSSKEALECAEPCILVTHETTPDDIAGMNKAVGILTQTGGATSHAAVVARAMDKPCIVGCTELNISLMKEQTTKIALEGSTGRVWLGEVPVIDSSNSPEVKLIAQWCMDKVGWRVATVVDQAEGEHTIQAAHWWGDKEVFEAIVEAMEEYSTRDHIILDMAGPTELGMSEDLPLHLCFGQKLPSTVQDTAFKSWMMGYLGAHPLPGLMIVNHGMDLTSLLLTNMKKSGFKLMGSATSMADVLEGTGMVNDAFIEKVIGGTKAWKQLEGILKAQGVEPAVVPLAVPTEYAVFTVLGSNK